MIQSKLRGRGLTRVEVAAVAVLVAVVLAVVIPVIAFSYRSTGHPHHHNQLRGIHQGIVIFAQSNKFYYPGLDAQGNPLPDGLETTGNSGEGTTVEARFWILLRNDFFTPEYAISPIENDPKIAEYASQATDQDRDWSDMSRPVTQQNYSYAMLDIDELGERKLEWRETANPQAVLLSDRNIGSADNPSSIHVEAGRPWKGHAAWNDNHVVFETKPVLETKYHNSPLFLEDELFRAESGDDALLIYSGQ